MKEAKLIPPPKTTTSVIKIIRNGSWQVFTGAKLYWLSVASHGKEFQVTVTSERGTGMRLLTEGASHHFPREWSTLERGSAASSTPSSGGRKGNAWCFVCEQARAFGGIQHCLSYYSLWFPGLDLSSPQIVSALFFFLVKDSPAMFKCWLRTKAGSEKRDWLLTHHWGGWVCPRQAKGSPSWRRGCVAFTPDQEQKAESRTTPHTPSLSHCLLNIAELSPSAHENTNKVQKCF